jgi:ABC-type phosphate transport system permease subunit
MMLAIARVSGETAASLFTAFNNRFLSVAWTSR